MGEQDNQQDVGDLKHLKEMYIAAASSIDKLQEPKEALNVLAGAMAQAVVSDRVGNEPAFATFLYEDLGPGLAKRLHKERSVDETYLTIVADVLENLVRLFALEIKQKRFNYSFYSAMALLFNHEASIHKYHYQIPDGELQRLRTHGQEWRSELGVGDMVDVYVKADDRGKLSGWMQAEITAVDGDEFYLEFPLSQNIYDGRMDRWSTDLVQFETKTKADYEWRRNNVVNAQMLECDVHDKATWNKATIFEIKKQTVGPGRVIDVAYCALRVYRDIPNSIRKDERGTYEGWSSKFDEWVPVFSPRLMPWATKVGVFEEEEIADDLDDLVQADEEFKVIYAVPRLQVCISALYLRYINVFGNEGCFDMILDLLRSDTSQYESFDVQVMGCLVQILTLPFVVYNKKFIEQNGKLIAETIKNRLVNTSDQALRDVRKEQIDAIYKSIDSISRRFLSKEERDKQSELLQLELCIKMLKSNFLERRIHAIRDLSQLIKNNTLYTSSKTFTTDFLIDWLIKNDVFSQIWDNRKTHLQIVQRSNEIFKLLLKENRLDDELLKLFWSLNTSEYQTEVLKIISECSFYLRQPQIEFFFSEVTQQPAEKLTLAEFDLLCDLGKQCKSSDFQAKVGDFFWHIILNADNYKEDLVDNATKKYADMIKYQDLAKKQALFTQLTTQFKNGQKSVLPTIRLFTRLIKDQKDRQQYQTYGTNPTTLTVNQDPVTTYSHVTSSGSVITSYSYKPEASNEESIYNSSETSEVPQNKDKQNEIELTLTSVLNQMQHEFSLVDSLLQNLHQYCQLVRTAKIDAGADRKKVFVQSTKHSHADEIEERLQFLKYYASVCDYQFRKVQLRVIYDSLSQQSPIRQDQTEFLNWCKKACQDSTADIVILDLNEVGEYFSELLTEKQLNVETLPVAGFEFLQNYFISVNENQSNLLRVAQKQKKATHSTAGVTWTSYHVSQPQEPSTAEADDDEPDFNVVIDPSKLQKLDLVWMVVLQARNETVYKKAIKFLIKIYLSLDEGLQEQRGEITQTLIQDCMTRLGLPDLKSIEIERIVSILKTVIQEAEKKGTADVQPHNAILKGESLDRIIIKNCSKSYMPNLVVKVLTSATVWEFVDKVTRMCELAPQYCDLKLQSGLKIKDSDYGKTLGEIGIRNYDIITVTKNDYDDDLPHVLLIDPETQHFTEKAGFLFSEWYDKYSNNENQMTPESTTRFILGATNELVQKDDGRIAGLFNGYDSDKDGIIERHEFLKFYEEAAKEKPDRVFDNLKNHFIRGDLSKCSEVYLEQSFTKVQMPRHTMSHNQRQFDTLMNLLDRNDGTGSQVWDLIRMLETNQKMYQQVLSLQIPDNTDNVQIEDQQLFWEKFFASGSIYKQQYAHEIIEALMEDGTDLTNRVFFVELQDPTAAHNKYVLPVVKQKQINHENSVMKQNWTNKFLENGGLNYVIGVFLAQCDAESIQNNQFKLQELKFMLSILRVYISAAIKASTQLSSDEAEQDFVVKKLTEIIQNGSQLLESIDFGQLQTCLLQLISQIVLKESHSFEEKNIIANALTLWKCCVFHKPELFMDFLLTDKVEELVMSGLLYCTEENIRQNFQATFLDVARNLTSLETETALGFLLKLLSKNFYQISDHFCRQFFELFNELIDLHFIKIELGTADINLFNAEDLLGLIIDKIRADNTQKKLDKGDIDEVAAKEQAAEKERLMIGLIQMTAKIIGKVDTATSEKIVREKDLISEIFKEFLFASVFSTQPKVKGDADNMLDLIKHKAPRKVNLPSSSTGGKAVNKSREAAYSLLNELIKRSPIIMNNFIKDQLKPLLEMIKKPKGWNYTPPNSSERVQKYVGLKNLGCICYMNSMMQQFFMIPAFRYNMLCVDDGLPENVKEYRNESIDDNMLHQMQRLFAHLELSERMDYNPIGFTFSFKEFDGQPTNTSEQKDAQEFLNIWADRVENALKPTSRKYLLQSVFGGKTCSQLICPECGKVKNRIEDQLSLSLTVKDLNSVHDSLEQQVQGEVISDFKCDGCDKKVDITKRVLIAETPNVLIVHLQRILFDFDTCQNEKLNQYFEFPALLDLKPYSYHEVMKREHRNKKPKDDDQEVEAPTQEQTEDNQEPIDDDCYEYKLVGVNVHSGSANAGHYWSYINTARGMEEKSENDPSWAETDKEPWMEFNDSTVKDYKFENLNEECYGDKQSSQSQNFGWGGGKYGKSGYMLFYERRVKKPIKIVVPADQATNNPDVVYDEKTKEYIKYIAYREGVDTEKPNQIFAKVLEDNTKFSFENDVYSLEFFDFIKTILQNVASFGGVNDQINQEMRKGSIEVAQKAAFDILARCFYNNGIKDLMGVMIEIFQQDEQLVLNFTRSIIETNEGECMFEILLDCTDGSARNHIGDLFRYLICKVKMIEKNLLQSEDHQKSVSAKWLYLLVQNMPVRAAKAWTRFDKYLELFYSFALESVKEVLDSLGGIQGVDKMVESLDSQVGMEYFFRMGMLEQILDFILGEKSPLQAQGKVRIAMGSSYSPPNFAPLMKVVSKMIGQQQLIDKYPLSSVVQQMMTKELILGKIVEDNASNKDFGTQISGMCKDNFKMTKKLAKIFLKAFNQNSAEKIAIYLKALKKFLLIDDSLQLQRLEWVLGVPQLKTTNQYRSTKFQYGVEVIERINDTAYSYISTLSTTFQPTSEACLLERLLAQRGRQDDFCIKAIKDIMSVSVKNIKIAEYFFRLPPNSYQYARYSDWFKEYIDNMKEDQEKNNMTQYSYYQARIAMTRRAFDKYQQFDEVNQTIKDQDSVKMSKCFNADQESPLTKSWLHSNLEVIKHWPPQVLVGKSTSTDDKKVLAKFEDDYVKVELMEVECEYMYGNPTGVFNLSLPERLMRTKNYAFISYAQFKDFQHKQLNTEEEAAPLVTREWASCHTSGPVLLQIFVTSKQVSSFKVQVIAKNILEEGQESNVTLPCTAIKEQVFGHDRRVIAHFMKLRPESEWGGSFELQVTHNFTVQKIPANSVDPQEVEMPELEQINSDGQVNSTIQEIDDEYQQSFGF